MIELAQVERLWLLAALPALWLLARRMEQRRRRDWAALGQSGQPASERLGLGLAGLAALVVALSGPRWGRANQAPLPPGRDVVVAVDVSRSMAALDAVPDRLGVAVEVASGLITALGKSPADRVAVVAFAGRGVLKCPLTRNLGAAVEALNALRPGDVQPGGTDLGAALDASLDAFDDLDRVGGRAVVLISDGEDHSQRWQAATERLKEGVVVVHTVAVGDDQRGWPVPVRRGNTTKTLQYKGVKVLSARTDAALEAVARETGGAFVPLGLAAADLGGLFVHLIEPAARRNHEAARASERVERFGLFLLVALVLLLAACRPQRSLLRTERRIALVSMLALILGASPTTDSVRAVAEGRAAYAAGQFNDALGAFQLAARLDPKAPMPRYNAAATLFPLGRFAEAQAEYLDVRERVVLDSLLRTKIDYALGNVALALGDPAAAVVHYDDCLASPALGAAADRVRRDALENRRFAEEQKRPDAQPEGEASSTTPKPDRGGHEPAGPNPSSPPAGSPPPGGGSPSESSSERRGKGGAGGDGPAPARAGSPEERLAKALENVREARRRRLADDEAAVADVDRKDW
jgi:Ca-activated chloride channel homolog